ncbi:MAG TPA: quinolinate synthase NadA [Syntrophales bacterium]|nr:quinolinate synthase NadA [Syntrophales bacterium]HOM06827.1 quinolinate synthase NadA [Syntrophales bacterium]HON99345.1 quinolinate synthase NadA [Syntrophales bacterium]HPC00619.1 quinolinate synthase NadA [Syntrophales bacterium]HPQ06368.1 quinolinate synthase NadA [Syntrophales bacterium]
MDTGAMKKEIKNLLQRRRGVLLAHYYQRPEVQEIADFVGDSLALSIEAARTDARVIVFAGVHFMAESAAVLSPDKTVLLPRAEAGCPLADMVTVEDLARAREEYPDAAVVTYVNSSAAVKAASDVCCTSANALKVVESLADARRVIMVPDGNLARYCARFSSKEIIPWRGYCPVHQALTAEEAAAARQAHPRALFAAHPECRPEVLDLADFVGSTAGILRFAGEERVEELIVGTEEGIFTELKRRCPAKAFVSPRADFVCPDMKYTTLADILLALKENRTVVRVPEEIVAGARRALDRMLAAT